MKKILVSGITILSILSLGLGTTSANHSHQNSGPTYKKVIEDKALNLKVKRDGNSLKFTWDAYSGEKFKWYKLVKSKTNKTPSYPEDKILEYIPGQSSNSVDIWDDNIGGYYRLCVIMSDNNRTCSNIINLGSSQDYNKEKKEHMKKKHMGKKKKHIKKDKVTKLVESFILKVESKYSTQEERINKLEQTISALNSLASKEQKYKDIVTKINQKIKSKIDYYQNDSKYKKIKSILDV